MNAFLMDKKYINASFVADYIIHDPNVIADVYLKGSSGIETLSEPEMRQRAIGAIAKLYEYDYLSSVNLKRIAGIIDNKCGKELKKTYELLYLCMLCGCYSDNFAKYFRKNKGYFRKLNAKNYKLFKSLIYDREGFNKLVQCSLEKLIDMSEEAAKEYRFSEPETYDLIASEFKMYKFESEDFRQVIYSLWLFVCDIPEIYREYMRNIDIEKLDGERISRLAFYYRMVKAGSSMSVEEKLEEIKAFEFNKVV